MSGTVFLDFDGVLNTAASEAFRPPRRYRRWGIFCEDSFVWSMPKLASGGGRVPLILERERVAVAQSLIATTGASIVISSTWREVASIDHIGAMLAEAGWADAPIVDVTPSAHSIGVYGSRSAEVRAWVKRHLQPDDRWVALDDNWDDNDVTNAVRVAPDTGLSEADADRAINILRGQ